MKRVLESLVTSAGLIALLPMVASAQRIIKLFPILTRSSVPELDPSLATTAIGLLVGGALVLTGRRRAGH